MNYGIKDKVAVVTGAGMGIGNAIARSLAGEGVKVCISDVNEEKGQAAADEINKNGGKAIFVKSDVSQEEDVKALFETVKKELGTVDILVNNAGIGTVKHRDFYEIPQDEFDKVLDVNLTGSYMCAKYAYEQMKDKGWGRIVNLASFAGVYGGKIAGVHYAASKGGVIAMTKTLARRMGPDAITVNSVAPGRIITPMTSTTPPEVEAELTKSISLRRSGTPEEVASVVCFLSSNEASYVSGTCIEITGYWLT